MDRIIEYFASVPLCLVAVASLCCPELSYGQDDELPDPNYIHTTIYDNDANGTIATISSRKFSDGQGHDMQTQMQIRGRTPAVDLVGGTLYDEVGRKIKMAKSVPVEHSENHDNLAYVHDDIFDIANSYYKYHETHDDSAYSSIQYWLDPLGRPKKSGSIGTNFTATARPVQSWYFGITGTNNPAGKFDADGFVTAACLANYQTELETSIPAALESVADANEESIQFKLTVTRDQHGNFSQQIQDVFGKTIRKKGTLNEVSRVYYDVLGRAVRDSAPQTPGKEVVSTRNTYNTLGQVVEQVSADGGKTINEYDDAGRVIKTYDANCLAGKTVPTPTTAYQGMTYDIFGRLILVERYFNKNGSDYYSPRTRTVYDNPAAAREFLASTPFLPKSPTADEEAALTEILDGLTNTIGRVVATIQYSEDFSGNDEGEYSKKVIDLFSYDDEGRVICKYKSIPGLKLQMSKFAYSLQGKVLSDTIFYDPDNLSENRIITNYEYDGNGRLSEVKRNGIVYARYEYDILGRDSLKTFYGDNTEEDPLVVSYSYDNRDAVTEISTSDNSFVEKLCYDENIIDALSSADGYTPQYNGNISRAQYFMNVMHDPSLPQPKMDLLYAYDAANRLTQVVNKDNTYADQKEYNANFSYLDDGRILQKHEGDDQDDWGDYGYYPETNRLMGIESSSKKGTAALPNYIYDYNGNMVLDRSKKMSVMYDGRNLPVHFRFYEEIPATVSDFQDVQDGINSDVISDVEMIYDASGNRVKKETFVYKRDQPVPENSLTIVDEDNGNEITITPAGKVLIGKPVSGMSTEKIYPASLTIGRYGRTLASFSRYGTQFAGEVYPENSTPAQLGDMLIYCQGLESPLVTIGEKGTYVYIVGSLPDLTPDKGSAYADASHVFEKAEVGSEYALNYVNAMDGVTRHDQYGGYKHEYYIKDHLGSTRVVKSKDGNQHWASTDAMAYLAYGTVMPLATSAGADVKRKFTGKEFDQDGGDGNAGTGINLDYFGKRYYDAEVGRWIATDPEGQFFDKYAYAGNNTNPVSMVDPDGGFIQLGVLIAGAALGVATTAAIVALQNILQPEANQRDLAIEKGRQSGDPSSNIHEVGEKCKNLNDKISLIIPAMAGAASTINSVVGNAIQGVAETIGSGITTHNVDKKLAEIKTSTPTNKNAGTETNNMNKTDKSSH